MKTRQVKAKINYDKNAGRELKPLHEGDTVLIQNEKKWIAGKIEQRHSHPRSYLVKATNGRQYRRNRRHIRPTRADFQPKQSVLSPEVPDTVSDEHHSDSKAKPEREPHVGPMEPPEETAAPHSPSVTSPPVPLVTRSGRVVRIPSRFED